MSDEQDGKIEKATNVTRIKAKETQSSTQPKKQITGTDLPASDKFAIDTFVAGGSVDAVPSGLKIAGDVTWVTIDDTGWTPLPAVAQVNRNAIAIQNKTASQIMVKYVNTGGYVDGMIIEVDEERQYDITDAITIYGRAQTGTVVVYVEELS